MATTPVHIVGRFKLRRYLSSHSPEKRPRQTKVKTPVLVDHTHTHTGVFTCSTQSPCSKSHTSTLPSTYSINLSHTLPIKCAGKCAIFSRGLTLKYAQAICLLGINNITSVIIIVFFNPVPCVPPSCMF